VLSNLAVERPTIFTALRIQGRVIGALILRESRTRFGKNRLGYFWAIAEPVIHMAIWVFAVNFVTLLKQTTRSALMPFLLTGFISFLAVRNIASFVERSVASNRALLYYPIVRPADFIIARWLLEIATQSIVAVLIILGGIVVGLINPPESVPRMALALATGFFFALGWGWCNAILSEVSLTYKRAETIFSRLLYYVSGVMYSIDAIPPAFHYWLTFNPLAHIVELFRSAYFPEYESSFASIPYVLSFGLVLLVIGIVALKLAEAKLLKP
jgi:capsular polysaccharide transport system permease protein